MNKLSTVLTSIAIVFICLIVCACSNHPKDLNLYQNTKLESDLFMAKDIQSFYDKVDTKYGYNFTKDLAQNPDIADFMLWRTAGSDGEHKAANYLENEMKNIGLKNVEKIGVPCDKFQFNNSNLKIDNTEINICPGAYFQSGTNGNLTAEIVNCGCGHTEDLAGIDLTGKIALIKIDVIDDAWINLYIRQAKLYGAIALVTWSDSGYGEATKDDIPITDVCCEDIMPTCAINANQAEEIINEINIGNNKCTLNMDCVLEANNGTTYNVVGMIPGKNHDNRILISGHYDKYWEGFQDDCTAIGLAFTIAKAMIDSKYEPENDIYFICHGAEEWGKINSQSDWATGSWELCDNHPEFCDNTLALINCELPAFKREKPLVISAVPEYKSFLNDIFNQKLIVTANDTKLSKKINPLTTKEDGISYRYHGVPYFFDSLNADTWVWDNYHTSTDNVGTYDEATFHTTINWFGALCIYIDAIPANPLDISGTASELLECFNEDYAQRSGVNVAEYNKALAKLESAGKSIYEKINKCNQNYNEAYKNNDKEKMQALRKEGRELNKKTHNAFKMVIDKFLKIEDNDAYYAHDLTNENLEIIDTTIDYMNKKIWYIPEEDEGLHTHLLLLNTEHNYFYHLFDKTVADRVIYEFTNDYYTSRYQAQWCWQKCDYPIDLADVTIKLIKAKSIEEVDLNYVASQLKNGQEQCYAQINKLCNQEIKDINEIANFLNN